MVFGMPDFGFGDLIFFPFRVAFSGVALIVALLLLVFWIWMIIDAAKRRFRSDVEKILWIVGVIVLGWLGALVYLIVIRIYNPKGLMKK